MLKRIFLAINLPEEIKKQLLEIIRDLENQFPENTIKWTQPENLHITIFFFGNKNENEIKNIIQSTFDLNIEKFKLKIKKIAYGPDSKNPKMIWAILEHSPEIKKINDFFSDSRKNKNNFITHITLARINNFALREMEFLPEIDCDQDIKFNASSMEFMESKLNQKSAKYKEIKKIFFK